MTDLLRSVVTVIDIFYKYTKQDGECGTLSKDELKELLEKEFRPILKVCAKSEGVGSVHVLGPRLVESAQPQLILRKPK